MTVKTGFAFVFIAGSLVLGSPASADSIKFYTGTTGYTGPFSGAGTVYQATKLAATNCPTPAGTCPGADVVSDPQTYINGAITITATATPGSPWDDLKPSFGGLGVGTGTPSDSDQIAGTDVLHLHFSQAVTLTGVGTLFVDPHKPFGTGFPTAGTISGSNTFKLSLTGLSYFSVSFGAANTVGGISYFSQDFYFKAKHDQPTYYVSALTYQPVPGPLAGAGLPGLAFAFASYFAWRRRQRQVRAPVVSFP